MLYINYNVLSDEEIIRLGKRLFALLRCFASFDNTPMSYVDIAQSLVKLNVYSTVKSRYVLSSIVTNWNNFASKQMGAHEADPRHDCHDTRCVNQIRGHRVCCSPSGVGKFRLYWLHSVLFTHAPSVHTVPTAPVNLILSLRQLRVMRNINRRSTLGDHGTSPFKQSTVDTAPQLDWSKNPSQLDWSIFDDVEWKFS
jgi:hypothetical protein